MKSKEMIGMRFGRLVVEDVRPARGGYVASCVCDCGSRVVVGCQSLRAGKKSCGCQRGNVTHLMGRGNYRTLAERRADEAEAMSKWAPVDRTQFDDLWMLDGINVEKWWKEHII